MKLTAQIGIISSFQFDSDAQNFFDRASTLGNPINNTRKILLNNLILRLKREKGIDGITSQYNSLDVINLIASQAKEVGFMNIKTASYGNIVMTVDTGTFTVDKGYKGNGTTARGDTNFNPFDGGTYNFKNNDNCFGAYLNTNTREVKGIISNVDGGSAGYEVRTHTGGAVTMNGTTATVIASSPDCTGSHVAKRFPSNDWNSWKNAKNNLANSNSVVTSTVNKTFKILCRDIDSVYSLYSLNRIAYMFFGSSNIDIQKLDRAIIEEYLKPIGGALVKRVVFDGNSFFQQLTMPTKVMDLLWTNGVECTSHYNAVFGISIATMISNAPTKVDAYQETYFNNEAFAMWELTNSMKGASANVNTVFTSLQTYFDARHSAGWTCPMMMNTCPPFASMDTVAGIYPSKRDNESDLFDDTKINGKIRAGLATLGINTCSDMGSGVPLNYDSVYKDSMGVAGVGELDTVYFASDGHMTTVGYNYWGQNHIYPQMFNFLNL